MLLRLEVVDIHHRIAKSFEPRSCSWPLKAWRARPSPAGLICLSRSSPSGVSASTSNAWPDLRSAPARAAARFSPPELVVVVKAIACELPARLGLPFARLQVPDIQAEVINRGLVASISDMTIWRWLDEDTIKPWTHRSWIFPATPTSSYKAARVLDLYAREFEDRQLQPDEFVISSDEKTSIQARIRRHSSAAANSHQSSMSTTAVARWPISRPGMCTGPNSSDAWRRPLASSRRRLGASPPRPPGHFN